MITDHRWIIIYLTLFGWLKAESTCKTPNHTIGNCVALSDCPSLFQISIQLPVSRQNKRLLQKRQCGQKAREAYVCCDDQAPFDLNLPTVLFPTKRSSLNDCPVQYYKPTAVKSKRPTKYARPATLFTWHGKPTSVDDFPHMAAIGWTQTDGSGVDWKCGGSLIASKWVLTAAHCLFLRGAPDVVRLGASNLHTSNDWSDRTYKIESRIRHPGYKSALHYNDIALIEIKGHVELGGNVAPACLWRDNSIEFKELEAAGWGMTETGEKSDGLMKVTLRPFSKSECSSHYDRGRKLPEGVRRTQLCAGDPKSDTCSGDSGGPLEVKLPGVWSLTPFVVGVTSFGMSCGSGIPGIYTRVSSYVEWIEQTLNNTVPSNPFECMLNYRSTARFNQHKGAKQISDLIEIDEGTKHVVQIGWSDNIPDILEYGTPESNQTDGDYFDLNANSVMATWECGGVLISENFVLTSAHCLAQKEREPDLIKTQDLQIIRITKIINHPEFKRGSYYHDLALVQLLKEAQLGADGLRPACLRPNTSFDTSRLEMSSFGATSTFARMFPYKDISSAQTLLNLKVSIPLTDNSDCEAAFQKTGHLPDGIDSDRQICMKNSISMLSSVCEISRGGGVHQKLDFDGYAVDYVFAVNSMGENCGFNTPIVATKIEPYLGWINSVVFGRVQPRLAFSSYEVWVKDMFLSISKEQQEESMAAGDECQLSSSKTWGLCVAPNNCTRDGVDSFCGIHPDVLVCCPKDLVGEVSEDKLVTVPGTILDCARDYAYLREKKVENSLRNGTRLPSMDNEFAHIGKLYVVRDPSDSCYTTLISDQHVITSVKCAANFQWKEMRLGWTADSQYFKIQEATVHPDYNYTGNVNDLAVLKLNTTVRFTRKIQPACIWNDKELVPYELEQQIFETTHLTYTQHYAYNDDCKRIFQTYRPGHQFQLNDTVMCVKENVCPVMGSTLQKIIDIDDKQVPFVFGVYFQERNCFFTDDRLPFLYTRLAPYVDWIQGVLVEGEISVRSSFLEKSIL